MTLQQNIKHDGSRSAMEALLECYTIQDVIDHFGIDEYEALIALIDAGLLDQEEVDNHQLPLFLNDL